MYAKEGDVIECSTRFKNQDLGHCVERKRYPEIFFVVHLMAKINTHMFIKSFNNLP